MFFVLGDCKLHIFAFTIILLFANFKLCMDDDTTMQCNEVTYIIIKFIMIFNIIYMYTILFYSFANKREIFDVKGRHT